MMTPVLTMNQKMLLGLLASLAAAPAFAQPGMGPSAVVAARVVEREVAATQTFVGTVTPVKRATIGAAVAGRVVEFPVEEGDRIEAGQTLAQLLTQTIELELAAAEAELDLRRSQLEELQNGSRPEEVEQARARAAAEKLRRQFLIARRDRLRAVFDDRGAVSEDEFEEAVSAAAQAEEAYRDAAAAYKMAADGPRREVIAQAQAEVAMQEAVVENLSDRIKKHTIITRFAGYVSAEHTEIGAWANQGDPVAEVIALDEVEVVVQVVEQSIPFVSPGMSAAVEIPALPGRRFEGTVVRSAPQADVRSRTFPVRVRVQNEISEAGPLLKAGMYARVALPVGAQQTALLAPKDAIVLGGPQPMVYVVTGEGQEQSVRPAPVELGVATGELIQVTGPLAAGDLVVVEGNERLRPQQPVRVARINEAPGES